MGFLEAWNHRADAAVALGWAIAWQSTLLALAVALAARTLARSSPSARHWLWQLVALKLLLMPLWTVVVPAWPVAVAPRPDREAGPGGPRAGRVTPVAGPTTAARPAGSSPNLIEEAAGQRSWARAVSPSSWLILAWAGLVVAQMGQLARQWRSLRALLGVARPLDDPALSALVAEASASLGLRNPPRAVVADFAGSPFVAGFLRPTLVLPSGLIAALEPSRWRAVIFHELAHVRRGDLASGWIPELARRFYPFHPVAHWAAYQARLERELACDAVALRHGGVDAAGYAMTLVEVVGLASPSLSLLLKEPDR